MCEAFGYFWNGEAEAFCGLEEDHEGPHESEDFIWSDDEDWVECK